MPVHTPPRPLSPPASILALVISLTVATTLFAQDQPRRPSPAIPGQSPTSPGTPPSTPGVTPPATPLQSGTPTRTPETPARGASEPTAVPPPATQPPPRDESSTPVPAVPLLSPIGRLLSRRNADAAPPGVPPAGGRPRPGSSFDPGAAGPGIDRSGAENFLDGALDPKTGWPFVFLDHFRPRPERLERFWIVSTRDCPQVMGSDPWACLKVLHFDEQGDLVPVDPSALMRQTLGHPVFIQVQGSLTTPDVALGGLLWTHSWLQSDGVMRPDTVVIAFDWPSQRIYRSAVRDIEEKGRRAYIAGFHLARFIQGFPAGSQVSVLGQSYGGRVVPSALHLLGGGALNSQDHDPDVRLPALRPTCTSARLSWVPQVITTGLCPASDSTTSCMAARAS